MEGVTDLYAAKGKNVVHLDLSQGLPPDDQLRAVMIGPTGNLRAPVLRLGKKLIIGFEPSVYRELFELRT